MNTSNGTLLILIRRIRSVNLKRNIHQNFWVFITYDCYFEVTVVPAQASKRNMKKIFLQLFPPSRFLVKTPRVNNIALKKISRSESMLNRMYRHSCIKLTHTSSVRS